MKEVMFVKKDRGCSSPADKANALCKCGHLASMYVDPVTGHTIKYYTMYALSDYDLCAEVTVVDDKVVSVRNVPIGVLKMVGSAGSVEFGGF